MLIVYVFNFFKLTEEVWLIISFLSGSPSAMSDPEFLENLSTQT